MLATSIAHLGVDLPKTKIVTDMAISILPTTWIFDKKPRKFGEEKPLWEILLHPSEVQERYIL